MADRPRTPPSFWRIYLGLVAASCAVVAIVYYLAYESLPPPPPRGTLRGVWTETRIGEGPAGFGGSHVTYPARGRVVEVLQADTDRVVAELITDEHGTFRTELPPGRYQIRYTEPYTNRRITPAPFEIGDGQTVEIPITTLS